MSYKVTLVRSMSGHPEKHRQTLRGLGLTRRGKTRVLPETPAIKGMIDQVSYLLDVQKADEAFQPFGRRSRAKAARAASAAAKA